MNSRENLVDDLKRNTPEKLEINGQIACGSYDLAGLDYSYIDPRFSHDIGDNKIAIFSGGEMIKVNIQTKEIISKISMSKFHIGHVITSSISMENKSYVALGDSDGGIAMLNIPKEKIEWHSKVFEKPTTYLNRNSGILYGAAHWGKKLFFAHDKPDISYGRMSIVNIQSDIMVLGNIVRDRNNTYTLMHEGIRIQDLGYPITSKNGDSIQGYGLTFIEKPNGDTYTIYTSRHPEGYLFIYDGKHGLMGMIISRIMRFPSERNIELTVLSSNDTVILAKTSNTIYVCDVSTGTILGQINHISNFRVLSENNLLVLSSLYEHKPYNRVALAKPYRIKDNVDLTQVLTALKTNTSVNQFFLSNRLLDEKSITVLHELKRTRPTLNIVTSETIQLPSRIRLDIEDEKLQVEQKHQQQLRQMEEKMLARLAEFEQKIQQSMSQQADVLAEMKRTIGQAQTELKETHTRITTLEREKHEQAEQIQSLQNHVNHTRSSDKKEQEEKFNKLEKKLQDIADSSSQELTQVLELLNNVKPSIPEQPLKDVLYESKELSEELLSRLLSERNIQHFSLIRWANHDHVKEIENELLTRGVILTVEALHEKVKSTKSTDKNEKIEHLILAVDNLWNDYQEETLPEEAVASLKNYVKQNVMKSILKEEKTDTEDEKSILRAQYLAEIDNAKQEFLNLYFKSTSIENNNLATCLTTAIEKLKKESSYYAKLLNKPDIISMIRSGNYDASFAKVVKKIKSSIKLKSIDLTPEIQSHAENAILDDESNEFGEMINQEMNKEIEKFCMSMKKNLMHYSFKLLPQSNIFSTASFFPPHIADVTQNPITNTQQQRLVRSMSAHS